MAFTSLRASAEYESAASGNTTLLFSPSTDVEVGDTVVLEWNGNVATLTATCADNSTQAGAANVYWINPTRTGTVHSQGSCVCIKATRKILTTDVVTVTVSSACTRVSGHLMAYVPANGNPRLEMVRSYANDGASPVAIPTSGTLYKAASLVVISHAWKGGAVASGFAAATPAVGGSWVAVPGGGALSGGTTTRVEQNTYYNLNVGATTAIAPTGTYTTITVGQGEMLIFTDEVPAGPPAGRSSGLSFAGTIGNITPADPTDIQDGDLDMCFIEADVGAFIDPGTWNVVTGTPIEVVGGRQLNVFWRIYTFGAALPVFGSGGSSSQILGRRHAIRNDTFDPTTPFEAESNGTEATVDTSFSFTPGTSTAGPNRYCYVAVTSSFDSGTGQIAVSPANTSLTAVSFKMSDETANGPGGGYSVAAGLLASAGSMGTWTATMSNATAKSYVSFAVRPWAAPGVSIAAVPATMNLSAPAPAVSAAVPPPVGSMTLSAPTPAAREAVPVPVASVALSAPAPIVSMGVPPPPAWMNLSAPSPATTAVVPVVVASKTLSAPAPAPRMGVPPPPASLTLNGPGPTTTASVPGAIATMTLSGPTPAPSIGVPPPPATINLSAPTPAFTEVSNVSAPPASMTLSAPAPLARMAVPPPPASLTLSAPTPAGSSSVPATSALMTLSSPAPLARMTVPSPPGTITLSMPIPGTGSPDVSIAAPPASLTMSAPTPAVTIVVPPPPGTITLSAPAPAARSSVPPPVASLTLSAPSPAPRIATPATAATITLSAPVPGTQYAVPASPASLTLSAPTPLARMLVPPPSATITLSAPPPILGATLSASAPPASMTLSAAPPAPRITIGAPPATLTLSAAAPHFHGVATITGTFDARSPLGGTGSSERSSTTAGSPRRGSGSVLVGGGAGSRRYPPA